jgi:NTE family protein
MAKQQVSLVLSSGGARGYAHIGVIEALQQHGYEICAVTGSSMGAVVGGVYAAGGLDQFKRWACSLERKDIFKMYDFVFSSQGLIRGERVFKSIQQYIPDRKIEELPIPFQAVATDLDAQKEVVFSSGSLYAALRASCAIPAVVKPAEVGDQELLDGGILSPLPIDIAARIHSGIVVAVNVNAKIPGYKEQKTEPEIAEDNKFNSQLNKLARGWFRKVTQQDALNRKKLGFFDLMIRSIDMMQDRITAHVLEKFPPDIYVQVSRSSANTFDYYKAHRLISEGRKAFEVAHQKYHSHELA